MLRTLTEIKKCTIVATDGDIGSISDVYLEDEGWTVRYFVVNTGTWLPGRKVLISPMSIRTERSDAGHIAVNLTRDQVRHAPDVDTAMPVSRQQELEVASHYGHPSYWEGPYRWGGGPFPGYWTEGGGDFASSRVPSSVEREIRARQEENKDPHLHSANKLVGYYIAAKDGDIGHVEELVLEERDWAIRYIVVDTRNWLPGRKVVISPSWVDRVSFEDSKLYVDMDRDAIESSPQYEFSRLDRGYETRLYHHYGKSGYWEESPESWKGERPKDERRAA